MCLKIQNRSEHCAYWFCVSGILDYSIVQRQAVVHVFVLTRRLQPIITLMVNQYTLYAPLSTLLSSVRCYLPPAVNNIVSFVCRSNCCNFWHSVGTVDLYDVRQNARRETTFLQWFIIIINNMEKNKNNAYTYMGAVYVKRVVNY